MASNTTRTALADVAVGLLTPFDASGEIEHWKLEENARSLYDEGIRTFLACANISEYHSLTRDERVAVTETSVGALPSDATVLAGVGGSTGDALDLIAAYDEIDVDAMMIMPPDHTYVHERGLLSYYRKLADGSDAPIVPYVRGFDPSVEFLADLTEAPDVVGIKYAIEDAVKLSRAAAAGDDEVVWVDGLAEPYAPQFFQSGARGFTAGVSNFEPRIGLALRDALQNENWERAREIRDIAVPYQTFRGAAGENNALPAANSVPAVKKGLELAGLHGGHVREPIVELSDADEKRAEKLYQQLQDDVERVIE